ncbi:disks large-associated protein 5 [Sigmodon hispidus]
MSASRVVPESGAARDLRRRISLKNPDPQSNKSESVEKTLFSAILESRSSRVEDTSSHGEQDSSAVDQPALSSVSPCTQVETSQHYHVRQVSFGGDLIVFSPETQK